MFLNLLCWNFSSISWVVFSCDEVSLFQFFILSINCILKPYNSSTNFFSYILNKIIPIPSVVNENAAKYNNVPVLGKTP